MTNQSKKAHNWDRLKSSFYWKINLDEKTNDVKDFTGYCKIVGQSEAQDKEYLLKSKICMLYKYGYLNPSKTLSIEIYERTTNIIDTKLDPKIIILYPTHFDIPQLNHDLIYKKFGRFLTDFYDDIKNNRDVYLRLASRKKPTNKDEFLNINRIEFRSVQHLYQYAARLCDYGHANGAVEDFIFKVKSKYNWLEKQK